MRFQQIYVRMSSGCRSCYAAALVGLKGQFNSNLCAEDVRRYDVCYSIYHQKHMKYAGKQATIITFGHNFIREQVVDVDVDVRVKVACVEMKKMSCLDCLMALRLSPVYLHTLKWHWHWQCLCHRQSNASIACHCHCHIVASIVLYSAPLSCAPRQIERSPGVAAVSVSASHYRRMASLPLLRLLSPYLLASPY